MVSLVQCRLHGRASQTSSCSLRHEQSYHSSRLVSRHLQIKELQQFCPQRRLRRVLEVGTRHEEKKSFKWDVDLRVKKKEIDLQAGSNKGCLPFGKRNLRSKSKPPAFSKDIISLVKQNQRLAPFNTQPGPPPLTHSDQLSFSLSRLHLQSTLSCLLAAALAVSALPEPSLATGFSPPPFPDAIQSLKLSSEQRQAGDDYIRGAEAPPLPTEYPPLPDVKEPPYSKLVLPNGLRVFLLEDHELGLVGGQLLVKGGTKRVPADKIGLAALTANVMRSGGTVEHPADQLDERLERLAAGIEAGAGTSTMSLSFGCLTEDLDEVFRLFEEVARAPRLPEDKLRLGREQLLGRIARRNDDPGGIAGREMPKLVYGKDSVYARVADVATVKAIDRSDLVDFHAANFRPELGVLGIWGDFSSPAVQKLIEERFGSWSPRPSNLGDTRVVQPVEDATSGGHKTVHLVDKPGLTQGYVRFGELGVSIDDPDVFALDVLNNVLNGFGGRLFNEVRSKEGLAYSVSGGWSPALDHRGLFAGGGETLIDTVAKFIESTQRVLRDARTEEVSSEELSRAKESSRNSFVFNFADSGAQLARIMTFDLFGVDKEYLFKYKAGIEETTGASVLAAAQRHLHPDSHKIVVVTDAKRARPLLEDEGWGIEPLELTAD